MTLSAKRIAATLAIAGAAALSGGALAGVGAADAAPYQKRLGNNTVEYGGFTSHRQCVADTQRRGVAGAYLIKPCGRSGPGYNYTYISLNGA